MTLPSFALKYGYNEMKQLVLTLFTSDGPMDGFDVAQRLRDEHRVEASIRAVQMALMRYWRQGLLHRERREGRYVYALSEKGGRRLLWLKGVRARSRAS